MPPAPTRATELRALGSDPRALTLELRAQDSEHPALSHLYRARQSFQSVATTSAMRLGGAPKPRFWPVVKIFGDRGDIVRQMDVARLPAHRAQQLGLVAFLGKV